MEFDLPVDRKTDRITKIMILSIVVSAFLPALIFYSMDILFDPLILAIAVLIAVTTLSLIPVFYFYTPKKVILNQESGSLIIDRKFGKIRIPYDSIEDVAFAGSPKIRKVSGSAGLFGYFGSYVAEGIGEVKVFARRERDFVLIKTDRQNYLISPENPDKFVEELRRRIRR
jgi:hypothetical protein